MADDDASNLAKIKQLTIGIRFESEAVRRQVETMLSRYQSVADLLGKTRELTRSEVAFSKEYLATVSKLASPMGEHVKQLSEASRAIIAMEKGIERYNNAARQAESVSDRLRTKLKGARKELGFREGEHDKALQAGPAPAGAIEPLRAKLETSRRQVDSLKAQIGLAERLSEKFKQQAADSSAILASSSKTLPHLEKLLGVEEKRDRVADKTMKRVETYDRRRKGTTFASDVAINVASDLSLPGISALAQVERYRRLFGGTGGRFGQSLGGALMGGARAIGTGALRAGGAIADVGDQLSERRGLLGGAGKIFGVIGRDIGGIGGGLRRADDSGGMFSALGGGLAGAAGIALGGLAVAGGLGVAKFREAQGAAESLAPGQGILAGQVGGRRMGLANAAYRDDLSRYGLDFQSAQAALIGLNRQVGGRFGGVQLSHAAALGGAFGQDVGEIGGQAGALMRAGGATPQFATHQLQRIMMEGVRAGMDRARITEFTQEVVGIQAQILRESGHNNAQAIARSLAQFMAASGKQGAEFFQGAGFAALQGLDAGMRGFARGGGGPGAGTIFRAFSPFAQGQGPAERFVDLERQTEGGLFGGAGGRSAAQNAGILLNQYFKESGAGNAFQTFMAKGKGGMGADERSAFQEALPIVQQRLLQERGIGVGQSDQLLSLMENFARRSPEAQKELKSVLEDMRQKTVDPLVALRNKMVEANVSLQEIAVSTKSMRGFMAVRDVEIGINRAARPLVEGGADAFATATNYFQTSVDQFGARVEEMKAIFAPKEAGKPGILSDMFADPIGASLDLSVKLRDAISALMGSKEPAVQPLPIDAVPRGGAGASATPGLMPLPVPEADDGSRNILVSILLNMMNAVNENTAASRALQGAVTRNGGRPGNVGASAGRQ